MKFITRELYMGMASEAGDDSEVRWRQACDAYRAQLEEIGDKLPPRMRAFAQVTLHDGVVLSVSRPGDAEVALDVDARRNPWGPVGLFRVRFTGVRHVEGIDALVGDEWLYEEVHLHPGVGFDYRVLFWRSDFRIVAEDVDVELLVDFGAGGND